MRWPIRTVVWEQGFYNQAHEIIPDPILLNEMLRGAEFRAARQPTEGTQLEYGVWYIVTYIEPIGRSLAIYYTFDDQKVYFHQAIERPFDPHRLIL